MSGITAGTVFYLKEMISVRPDQITSRTLTPPKIPHRTITHPDGVLYAMAKHETISSETSPHSKIIFVLEGELHMLVADQACHLAPGAAVWIQANTWHDFAAHSNCKFLQINI